MLGKCKINKQSGSIKFVVRYECTIPQILYYCTVYNRAVTILFNYYFRTSGFWPHVRARALRAPIFLG
jgi:hypothetical protein